MGTWRRESVCADGVFSWIARASGAPYANSAATRLSSGGHHPRRWPRARRRERRLRHAEPNGPQGADPLHVGVKLGITAHAGWAPRWGRGRRSGRRGLRPGLRARLGRGAVARSLACDRLWAIDAAPRSCSRGCVSSGDRRWSWWGGRYPNGCVIGCQKLTPGLRAPGSPLAEKAAPRLCRMCPDEAPPGATGRRRWAKNASSERFTQKNLFLRALRWFRHRGALVFLGVERDRGARPTGAEIRTSRVWLTRRSSARGGGEKSCGAWMRGRGSWPRPSAATRDGG